MGGFASTLGHLLKTGFEATATGQRYQQTKMEEQQRTLAQEQADRQFAEYVQNQGGRFVHNGIVQRDHVMPDGTVLPGALLDKAGSDGRPVISHKTANGEKLQWELPTADEQIGFHAGRLATAFKAEAPTRQAQAQEATTNAGNLEFAKTAGENRANTENRTSRLATEGVGLPDFAKTILPGSDGRRYLPQEIGPLLSGLESGQRVATQVDQAKRLAAAMDVAGTTDQPSWDAVVAKHPDAGLGAVFNPAVRDSFIRTAVPPEKLPEYDIATYRANAMKTASTDIGKQVDTILDPKKYPQQNTNLKTVVDGWVRQGKPEEAQKAIAEAAQNFSQNENTIARETDPRVLNARVGVAVATEKAKAALAPGGFGAIIDPATRNRAEVEYDKSAKAAGDTIADARRVKTLIQAAQGGNKAAPGLIPIAELRTFVNRVNAVELRSISSGAGSMVDRIQGWLQGAAEGQPIPPDVLSGMTQIADAQEQLATQKHAAEVAVLNGKVGTQIKPVDFKAAFGGAYSVSGKIIVTAPDGSQHPFDTQAQADAFKKLAGIK